MGKDLLSSGDGARGRFTPDFANDRDWAILEHNATMAARLCREAGFQGFWLDTEQYGNYRWRTATGVPEFDPDRPKNLKFPLGRDTPELLRRRGAQWIRAVQSELPAVKIMITFAWSPDANGYEPLKGVNGFLDGVLDGIQAPAQLIHGYENTFYYGQGPGTTHTREGFAGDRNRYAAARESMRQWRAFSANPKKYDAFLKVGMAAWVEDDPCPSPWPTATSTSGFGRSTRTMPTGFRPADASTPSSRRCTTRRSTPVVSQLCPSTRISHPTRWDRVGILILTCSILAGSKTRPMSSR